MDDKLCQKTVNEIKEYIKEMNYDKSTLITILHKAQGLVGYLPREVLTLIAEELQIPLAKVYGVVTFYSYFHTEPKGKYVINVCMGTACFVKGADKVLEEFERLIGIKAGETSEDGKYTLMGLRCIGACGLAPVLTINGKVYGKVSKDMVKGILEEYKD